MSENQNEVIEEFLAWRKNFCPGGVVRSIPKKLRTKMIEFSKSRNIEESAKIFGLSRSTIHNWQTGMKAKSRKKLPPKVGFVEVATAKLDSPTEIFAKQPHKSGNDANVILITTSKVSPVYLATLLREIN